MVQNKINTSFWDNLKAKPDEQDALVINDAFSSNLFTDSQKTDLAELILAGRIRIMDDARAYSLNEAIGIFQQNFSSEEFFYMESVFVNCTWRYSFKDYAKAIPYKWAKAGISQIYNRLGIKLTEDEIINIYNSSNIYSDFFDLIKTTLDNNKYIMCPDPTNAKAFVFASYFNMWHFFGIMGFNGYSPYTICADIGVLSVPASDWRFIALPEGAAEAIEELNIRARGKKYPTLQQNQFLAKLAKI